MLDIVGAITLTVLSVTAPGALILASRLDRSEAARMTAVAGAWFVTVTALAAAGVFTSLGAAAVGVAAAVPVALAVIGVARDSTIRTLAFGVPLAALVLVNAGRLLGAFFLLLHAEGRLPTTFALSAAWGDIAVATLALPIAWMVKRRALHWRPVTLVWNGIGLLDLMVAVTLGIGSAPLSPVRFIFEDATPNTMGMLPWLLVPGFLVPLYVLTHVVLFARIAADRTAATSPLAVNAAHR